MDEETKLKQLKTIQTLEIVSLIAAPASLLIGGLLLSCTALICAIIAFVKIRQLRRDCENLPIVSQSLYTQSIVALVVSCAITGFNLVWFIFAFATLMQMIQSGEYSQIMDVLYSGDFSGIDSTNSDSSKSVWD